MCHVRREASHFGLSLVFFAAQFRLVHFSGAQKFGKQLSLGVFAADAHASHAPHFILW